MSSSLSTRQSTTWPDRLEDSHRYRQIEYHSGRGRRIVESSRRRPDNRYPTEASTSYRRAQFPPSPASSYAGDLHVTLPRRAQPKVKATIIQTPLPSKDEAGKPSVLLKLSDIPTPPPTPKIERLATPDLSDLDDAPFCDCCFEAHVVKFCASCGGKLPQK